MGIIKPPAIKEQGTKWVILLYKMNSKISTFEFKHQQ